MDRSLLAWPFFSSGSGFGPQPGPGQVIAVFALSEQEAGSDVAELAMTARREGDDYVLDGGKTWISNAGLPDAKWENSHAPH